MTMKHVIVVVSRGCFWNGRRIDASKHDPTKPHAVSFTPAQPYLIDRVSLFNVIAKRACSVPVLADVTYIVLKSPQFEYVTLLVAVGRNRVAKFRSCKILRLLLGLLAR